MAEPMKIRATLTGDTVEVKILFRHPMISHLRWTSSLGSLPTQIIETISGTCNGRLVLFMHFGFSVSRDPFFSFKFKGASLGDEVEVTWLDSDGETQTNRTRVVG
jgi:sulfur-oxidizing protein SoxZ